MRLAAHARATRSRGRSAAGAPRATPPEVHFVAPSELPDYKPPFFANSVRVDTEGNLWILTIPTRKIDGGPVYFVVNGEGKLVDRVQVPPKRRIAGFGPAGAVYLQMTDDTTTKLERSSVR